MDPQTWTIPPDVLATGSLCGYDSGVEDEPYLYYVNEEGSGVCVDSCPSEDNYT